VRHELANIKTTRRGPVRQIECPLCRRTFSTPARNALAESARLRGQLAKHMETHREQS
jgi:hypothetical protein